MDIRRRAFLLSATAAALSSDLPLPVRAQPHSARLATLFDDIVKARLQASPEETTLLGLDAGPHAWEKWQLDDRSPESIARQKHLTSLELARLRTVDRAALAGKERVDYDVVRFALESTDAANRRYAYGPQGAGAPYVLSHLTGAYVSIPAFLDSSHAIVSKDDADAYLARLTAFALAMDREREVVRHDAKLGCTPPAFVLTKALEQMQRLRSADVRDAGLVTSVALRSRHAGIPGDYGRMAADIVSRLVYPALDRQIALVRELGARAMQDPGVWKLPDGESYYADSLTAWTTSPLPPARMHQLGLATVAELSAEIDRSLAARGLRQGTVSERLRALFADLRFRYPNTTVGKVALLAALNAKVRSVHVRLPQYFGVLPKAGVVVERVPQYMEAARPSGYYQPPSLDGKRPGIYYINLRDTAETPSWTLPTSTYHSSIPGHHLKYSVYQEAALPLIRKLSFCSAYLEGWALYAENLADEMGMFEDDPFGRIGFLQGALRAGVAMVVDSGLHAMRWTRERAIRYRTSTLGEPVRFAATEVDRYCIWPGQVCSYTLDKMLLVDLRNEAKATLGPRFDIRHYHDAVLLCGAAPQSVLRMVVDNYTNARTVTGTGRDTK